MDLPTYTLASDNSWVKPWAKFMEVEKFSYDKKLIVKELAKHGIQALLTSPEQLTINTINKYLELKSRGMI